MGEKNIKFGGSTLRISGFTLIEVIVIVSILAFLGSMVLSSIAGQVYKGNDAKRKADLSRLQIAFEDYEKDHNCYPPATTITQGDMLPYLDKIPKDPKTGYSYGMEVSSGSCAYWYKLSATLENPKDPAYPTYRVSSPNAP